MANGYAAAARRARIALALLALAAVVGVSMGCGATAGERGPDGSTKNGAAGGAAGEGPGPPNIVVIPTDDLAAWDVTRETLEYMPNIRREFVEGGTTFENAFVTNSACCPSRATILRGQYTHNHQVLHNAPPLGGAERFRVSGGDASTAATWLQEGGYRTAFFGKYLNAYGGTYVPPGWDEWYGISGNFLSSTLNENGIVRDYDPDDYHLDDVLSEKVSGYVERTAGADPPFFTTDRPFLMWIGTKAPHQPATPAPRHEDELEDVELPKSPSFDEKDVSDKPAWIRYNPPLEREQVQYLGELNRERLRSMMAVDDMVSDLFDSLRESGELDDTYVFFTSDNGFHLGEHRLGAGKWTAYEEDIRVPLMVRGPGVPEGKTLPHMVLNNDLAPTFADLGEVDPPGFADGRSLKPLLDETPTGEGEWRQRFLVEAVAERGGVPRPPFVNESRVVPLVTGDPLPRDWRRDSVGTAESSETWGRPWLKALRTERHLFVEYKTGKPGVYEHELYDLQEDPYQLENIHDRAPENLLEQLNAQLDSLRQCEAEACRTAEGGDV